MADAAEALVSLARIILAGQKSENVGFPRAFGPERRGGDVENVNGVSR